MFQLVLVGKSLVVYQCAYSTIQPSISPVPSVYSSSDLAELGPPGIHPTVTQGRCYDLSVHGDFISKGCCHDNVRLKGEGPICMAGFVEKSFSGLSLMRMHIY